MKDNDRPSLSMQDRSYKMVSTWACPRCRILMNTGYPNQIPFINSG